MALQGIRGRAAPPHLVVRNNDEDEILQVLHASCELRIESWKRMWSFKAFRPRVNRGTD
jgi:hypothetical protein